MTAFDDILAWSQGRPHWQRDALRRVIRSTELTVDDIADVLQLLKAHHGLAAGQLVAQPLTADHIPDRSRDATPVALVSLGELSGVNAIASDQTISFARNGITVVYGDNGAGKSGYVRVLRKLCRARDPGPPILSNAFEQPEPGPCAASVAFVEGADEVRVRWTSDTAPPASLSRVSVFDRDSAAVYVTGENELAYLPLGLDVPERLVALCDALRRALEQELAAARAPELTVPEVVSARLATLGLWPFTEQTDPQQLPGAPLSDAEAVELGALENAALAPDPATTAAGLRHRDTRLSSLGERLEQAHQQVGVERLHAVAEALSALSRARETEAAVAEHLAQWSVLAGAGGDQWRTLWEAARTYAEKEVHPGRAYPESSGLCVLCQQELGDEARDRFARFEEFVRDQATTQLDQARAAVDLHRRAVESLQVARDLDMEVVSEVAELDPEIAGDLTRTIEDLQGTRRAVIRSIEEGTWTDPPQAQVTALGELAALARRSRDDAGAMEQMTRERDVARRRMAELETRDWVARHMPEIRARISWLDRRHRFRSAISATDTTAITREGSDLAEEWATQELADAFSGELALLTSGQVRVALRRAGGARGVAHHRLELDGARDRGVTLPDVVSEGEHRAIAIAAFFAEVAATGSSAVVADDPTSSLDHRFRRRIARRFASTARDRQVVVFTHDIVFLYELEHHAGVQGVPIALRQLSREGDRAGIYQEGLPWHAQRVSERLNAIDDDLPNLRLLHNNNRAEYEPEARRAYGRLRQAWERAVEEVLLNEALTRFSPAVQTQRLRRISDVTEDDLDALEEGMSKCSAWLEGHDQPIVVNEPLPDPDEMAQDVQALREWIRAIRRRRGG